MKKKVDEYQIYEKYYEQIFQQVKNDPFAQSLGIQLTKFEAGFAEAILEVKSHFCSLCIWKNTISPFDNHSIY